MSKSILLIDEEEQVTRVYVSRLREGGFEVEVRHAVDDALGLMRALEKPYDAIVIDVMMPWENYGRRQTNEGLKTGVFLYRDVSKLCQERDWLTRFYILTNVATGTVREVMTALQVPCSEVDVLQKTKYTPVAFREHLLQQLEGKIPPLFDR